MDVHMIHVRSFGEINLAVFRHWLASGKSFRLAIPYYRIQRVPFLGGRQKWDWSS